ncbi:MAG: hypothetical protein ACRCXL_09835 [Dermatophilaceae bacterium]
MPVPLPRPADTLLTPPDIDEVVAVWRALVTAVGGSSAGLSPLQELLLRAVTRSLTGVDELPPPEPLDAAEFATRMARRDLAFRTRVSQIMMLGALVRRPPDDTAMRRIAGYLEELSLDGQLLEITAGFADGGWDLAVRDFDRLGHLGGPAETSRPSPLVDADQGSVWAPSEDDPALAGRWQSLAELPSGTVGRGVHDFYLTRGFVVPGLPGSAPPLLAQHDWVHVVADYGTTVENEVEVFGYIARANDDPRAFSLLAMVVSLFETGLVGTGLGLFVADPGHLDSRGMPDRLGDALRRGALTTGSNDLLALDWFDLADRPVEVLRRELGIPPKDAHAVAAGSRGPWDDGGISPFQLAAGRARAEAEGRDYDALGAPRPAG